MDFVADKWVWQSDAWPNFAWQEAPLQDLLLRLERQHGILLGKASLVVEQEQELSAIVANIVDSFAIENETLNPYSLRSSLAKQLGLEQFDPNLISTQSDGLAQLTLDSLQNLDADLTLHRLLAWHKLLFNSVQPDLVGALNPGDLRGNAPMQVVSGRLDRPKIHYEAVPRETLESELTKFLHWFNQTHPKNAPNSKSAPLNSFLRAAICHFWFISLHPFEDGNGRITRALTDLVLAQAESQTVRLFAMATTILENRKSYYEILEASQKFPEILDGKIDITAWLRWFLQCLLTSVDKALAQIDLTLAKTKFWQTHQQTDLSAEQKKVLNRLLDGGEKGFEQGISASQYQKVAKVSKATATRHLADLVEKNCLQKLPGGGRSTRYTIV